MKKNKITPLPFNGSQVRKNDDVYYEIMLWGIYGICCCIILCIGFIIVLFLVNEKENNMIDNGPY